MSEHLDDIDRKVITRSVQHQLAVEEVPHGIVYGSIVPRAIELAIEETLRQINETAQISPERNEGV